MVPLTDFEARSSLALIGAQRWRVCSNTEIITTYVVYPFANRRGNLSHLIVFPKGTPGCGLGL